MIQINRGVSIPDDEIHFTAARSSGPGGQHVNKVSSRVTLLFDLEKTDSLTEEEKRRVISRLSTRINRAGILRVVCQPAPQPTPEPEGGSGAVCTPDLRGSCSNNSSDPHGCHPGRR